MKIIIRKVFLYLIFITSSTTISTQFYDNDHIIELDDRNDLEQLLQQNIGPCLIYFYMNNCSWCSKLGPIIESLSQNKQFLDHITFYKANGPQTQATMLVQQYLKNKITGYPTIFFMNQGKVFDTQIGGTSQEIIAKKLQALIATSS